MLQAEQLLQQRYRLQQQLGCNANRQTWLATDTATSIPVILKFLAFSPQMQWEEFKLFEREAEVLKSLNLPLIPRYRDCFSVDTGEGLSWFALVQDYIPGKSLQQLLDEGYRFNKKQIHFIARQILDTLQKLHASKPPILHRDIKPSNLILSQPSAAGKRDIYLIDFGAVSNCAATESITFTIVGTAGYAPLEQFWGKAVPASDLYALGATLIHLLTGISPAELPQQNLRVSFRNLVNVDSSFLNWLETLTEPDLNHRFSSASQALEALKTGTTLSQFPRPENSRISLDRSPDRLIIKFPQPQRSFVGDLSLILGVFAKFAVAFGAQCLLIFSAIIVLATLVITLYKIWTGDLSIIALIIPLFLSCIFILVRPEKMNAFSHCKLETQYWLRRQIGASKISLYCDFISISQFDIWVEFLPAIGLFQFERDKKYDFYRSRLRFEREDLFEKVIDNQEVLKPYLAPTERDWILHEIFSWLGERQNQFNTEEESQ